MRSLLAVLLVISGTLFTVAEEQPPESSVTAAAEASNPMPTPSGNSSTSEPAITLKATTRMVVLDVVASDKQGSPVTVLKASDFRVLENGHEQRIRTFGHEQPATGAAELPATLTFPPNVFSNIQFTHEPKTLNVILLDALNTTMSYQMYVRQQMLRFLETMPAGQPIAVYTLNRSLRLLHDFTTDSGSLKELAKNYRAEHSAIPDNLSGIIAPGALDGNPLSAGIHASVQSFLDNKAEFDSCNRIALTTQAVQTLARTLAGYPGRKNLIWISEGFPLMFFPENEKEIVVCGRDQHEMALKVSSMLADTRIAVYPVDAVGLVAGGLDLAIRHLLMEELAARTGGKAFYNRNAYGNSTEHYRWFQLLYARLLPVRQELERSIPQGRSEG